MRYGLIVKFPRIVMVPMGMPALDGGAAQFVSTVKVATALVAVPLTFVTQQTYGPADVS